MRLALIGAGGLTTPLIISTLISLKDPVDIKEIILFDINKKRLGLVTQTIKSIINNKNDAKKIIVTDKFDSNFKNIDCAILSIRPGLEHGRIDDEKICLKNRMLANETVGGGGFSFACRAIPQVLNYAFLLKQNNPEIWLINFTNPVGMVVQALYEEGIKRVIGICSTSEKVLRKAATYLSINPCHLTSNVFGLNHLSWMSNIKYKEKSLFDSLLQDDEFLEFSQANFSKNHIRTKHLFFNDYLKYYYHYDELYKLQNLNTTNRAELVRNLNLKLWKELEFLLKKGDDESVKKSYIRYIKHRKSHYMARMVEQKLKTNSLLDEGYSGVAIKTISGLFFEKKVRQTLSLPLGCEYDVFKKDDIVEITCTIQNGKIKSLPPIALDYEEISLVRAIKKYEKIAVQSIINKSIDQAKIALEYHPLIGGRDIVDGFVEDLMIENQQTFSDWS